MPILACGSIASAIDAPAINVADDGGLYVNDPKGGNGLSPPVPANPDQGLSRGIGVVGVPLKVNVGAKGLLSVVWSSSDSIWGAVNNPKTGVDRCVR